MPPPPPPVITPPPSPQSNISHNMMFYCTAIGAFYGCYKGRDFLYNQTEFENNFPSFKTPYSVFDDTVAPSVYGAVIGLVIGVTFPISFPIACYAIYRKYKSESKPNQKDEDQDLNS